MKATIIILLIIFAGWKAAVFLTNKSSGSGAITTNDSSTANAFSPDLEKDSSKPVWNEADTTSENLPAPLLTNIDTRDTNPQQIVDFAKTLIGIPYLYGSTDPANGFDCSGFITYVFNHFKIPVPRSSIEFTNVGNDVSANEAKAGDLILFTGTDSTEKFVGHMGIVVSNTDTLRFIHSTSGKQYGVTVTPLTKYYQSRFVKTVRVFTK